VTDFFIEEMQSGFKQEAGPWSIAQLLLKAALFIISQSMSNDFKTLHV